MYKELVEKTDDPVLIDYMKTELEFINSIIRENFYNIYDLGSGYGRVLSQIVNNCTSITAIEIDNEMINGFDKNHANNDKITIKKGDVTKISKYLNILPHEKPLFLLCQNTIGSLIGDVQELVEQILKATNGMSSELVVSVFNKEVMKNYGIELYTRIEKLSGKIDYNQSAFEDGLIKMNTGYESKWWSKNEILELFSNHRFELFDEKQNKHFSIYHFKIA